MAEGLLYHLGFSADTIKLKDFVKSIGDLNTRSVAAAFGMAGLYDMTAKILDVADKNALSLNNFAGMTGQSTQQLQKWDTAAQEAGISAGVFAQSVDRLVTAKAQMLKTGTGLNAGMWSIIGVNPMQVDSIKTIFEVLKSIDKMYHGDVGTQRWALRNLGLDESLVLMVGKSYKEIQENIANSNKDLARMKEYHAAITELSRQWDISMTTLGGHISTAVVPQLKLINMIMAEIEGRKFSQFEHGKTVLNAVGATPFGSQLLNVMSLFKPEMSEMAHYDKNVERNITKATNFYITQHIATDKPKDAADESYRSFKRATAQSGDRGN